MCCKKGFSPDR
ncbi:hypothetical protein F383_06537 [Gossypium arboreum]|uniref:Uncharacterized protein n=1 Tax=Gossypium arboreum TaxID=29729 RepID=A0A0B0NVS9_GOSAR|nr:hypothetical protein F383_06537 [Gossypium arboreum]